MCLPTTSPLQVLLPQEKENWIDRQGVQIQKAPISLDMEAFL